MSPEGPSQHTFAGIAAGVGEIVEKFRHASRSHHQPSIEDYLPRDGALQPIVLVELIHAELELRLKAGEPIRVESYVERFPQISADRGKMLNLIAAEYQWRKLLKDDVEIAEYLVRFPAYSDDLSHHLTDESQATHQIVRDDPAGSTHGPAAGARPGIAPAADLLFPHVPGYQILGKLGRGGMGIVYRAFDQRRKQMVALKTILSLNPKSLYRFKQEFRTLADVAHPNLVSLYELVSDGDQWFFTMELVDGVDFFSAIRSFGDDVSAPLSSEQLARLRSSLRQLADGMAALHAAGKLHRDIKPTNVLVSHECRVVVLDFGLAAELDQAGAHQSTEQHILGTAAYMAPEQAASKPVSPASDWYSVGVMLFQVLTGRLPFDGRPWDILRQKQDADAVLPALPQTPDDLRQLCQELLQRDPRARPSGADVLRRLSAETSPADPVAAAVRPRDRSAFVGRIPQLQALREAFDDVRRRQTVAVMVSGRSGTGKSALVQHFLDELRTRREAVVLAGRCYEREQVPYKALDSLIDALSRFLGRLPPLEAKVFLPREVTPLSRVFPVLRRVEVIAAVQRDVAIADAQELRHRAFAALRELLARLGDATTLVLHVDDLQWGDADSAALLREVLRPPDPPVLLLLGCYRSEDESTSLFLRNFVGDEGGGELSLDWRKLALAPLDADEALRLAMNQLDTVNPAAEALARSVARESGGSPLFIQELLQSLSDQESSQQPLAAQKVDLDEVLWRRVESLHAESRALVEAVCVAGQPLPAAAACHAAGLWQTDQSILAGLRAVRLIRSTGLQCDELIEAYHDRVRESVVAHLPPERLAAYHRRLAEALEALGDADPERLALHWQSAGEPAMAGAYYAAAAARASETLAFDRAAKFYRLALELSQLDDSERHKLQVALADTLANAGRGVGAADVYRTAAASATGAEALELRRRAAKQLLISGHMDQGLAALHAVLAAVGMKLPRTPKGALASLLFRRAQLRLRGLKFQERAEADVEPQLVARMDICWSVAEGLSIVDTIRGADYHSRYLLLALESGVPARVARGLAFNAAFLASEGPRMKRRVESLLKTADELAAKIDEPSLHGFLLLTKGMVAFLDGRWRDSVRFSDAAESIFRNQCTGAAWEISTAQSFASFSLYYLGEIVELTRRIPLLCQEAEERGNRYALTNHKGFGRYLMLLAADAPATAERELEEVMESWSQSGFHTQHMNAAADTISTLLYSGNPRAAWKFLEEHYWPNMHRSLLSRIIVLRVFSRYLRGCCAVAMAVIEPADRLRFLAIARQEAVRLRRLRIEWAEAMAEAIDAGAASLSGDRNRAIVHLRQAAEKLDRAELGLHAASARLYLGRLLGGDEGGKLVEQAEAWMASQEIKAPARIAATLIPGIG